MLPICTFHQAMTDDSLNILQHYANAHDLCLYARGKMGKAPDPAPRWVGNIIAKLLTSIGPKGLEFGRYSIDYHYIRNYIHVNRHWESSKAKRHIPKFAMKLVDMYNKDGSVDDR